MDGNSALICTEKVTFNSNISPFCLHGVYLPNLYTNTVLILTALLYDGGHSYDFTSLRWGCACRISGPTRTEGHNNERTDHMTLRDTSAALGFYLTAVHI
jgi:hypothetical protein